MTKRRRWGFLALSALFFTAALSRTVALDGMWILQNEFKMAMVQGTLSGISTDQVSILGSFMFDLEKLKEPVIPTKVSLFDPNLNKQVSYDGTSIDGSRKGVIFIAVQSLNLMISLFLTKIDERSYSYCYAIGIDPDREVFFTVKDAKKMYFIYSGIMVKAGKQ